jgi:hypothetical protein
MTLIKLPDHPVKVASASATELAFSSDGAPSAKLSLNINAFNGNNTNFGGRCNGNK